MRSEAWWRDDDALRRFLGSLLTAELARLRPRPVWPPPGMCPADALDVELASVWLDSLDLLQLTVAVTGALGLSPAAAARLAGPVQGFAVWLPVCRAALAEQGSRIAFRSSGSTGAAALHSHGLAQLEEEAAWLVRLMPARSRVLSAVPAHHIYGFLFTVLLPAAAGALPVVNCASPLELAAIWQPGDLVVAYPEFWQACAALSPVVPRDITGVTSTAPCPAPVSIALGALGLRLVEVFGSSETAGLGWRADPDAAFESFPWWRPAAAGSVERRQPDGERTVLALVDHLDWLDDTHFVPGGRRDGQVQVGGINVSPAQVRRKLLQHPWVADAAVRLMRRDEGQRLKALVVAGAAAPAGRDWMPELQRWIANTLSAAERPVAVRRVDALPTGTMGKAADWDA